MCNLYNATTTHEAMRQLFLPINDLTNRLTPQMDVFPDYPAGRMTRSRKQFRYTAKALSSASKPAWGHTRWSS
jgi:hypothetical protein